MKICMVYCIHVLWSLKLFKAPSPVYQQLLEIEIMNVFILLMISSFYLSHLWESSTTQVTNIRYFTSLSLSLSLSLALSLNYMRKLHFTTLNYPLDYTLHPKLSNCTLYTLNYHTYQALHPGVIFTVIFNRILLHVTSTCFLLR